MKNLLSDEGEQIGIDSILERCAHAVRGTRIDLERRVLDDLGCQLCCGADRHDLIVVTVTCLKICRAKSGFRR